MTRFNALKTAVVVLAIGISASATTLTYNSWAYVQNYTPTAPGGAGDASCGAGANNTGGVNGGTSTAHQCEMELEEHDMYAWKITGINLTGLGNITSATLKISNITNWDTNANELFLHLLNSATNNGITKIQKDNPNVQPVPPPFHDYWTAGSYPTTFTNSWVSANVVGSGSQNLIPSNYTANAGGNTRLNDGTVSYGSQVGTWNGGGVGANRTASVNNLTFPNSVPASGGDFVYTFSAADLIALANYIASGNDIALGFDPNCAFWNDGITLTINTSGGGGGGGSVPEPTTLLLLSSGLLLVARRMKGAKAR
jgi:hypothetical protein